MRSQNFKPHHMNATHKDLSGNNGIGRYVLLPGSDGRAKEISCSFDNLIIKSHPRGHNLYLGTIQNGSQIIDVAVIASGMGCPSMEIILHELYHLGAKRFLRVGTAGSLQSKIVKIGHIVNAQAAVRDEHTTLDYAPIALPAMASLEYVLAIIESAKKLQLKDHLHTGIVHCKSSLYAREFGIGPQGQANNAYIDLLTQCGVFASEMETATLFIQTQFYNYELMQKGMGPQYQVLCGAILGILSLPHADFTTESEVAIIENKLVDLALESVKALALTDQLNFL